MLIFMRHGDAGAYTLPDNARALSKLGARQASASAIALAQFLDAHHLTIDTILVSPYVRAKQTLAVVQHHVAHNLAPMVLDTITPNGNVERAVADIYAHQGACTLVVCHMPIVAKMAHAFGGSGASFDLAQWQALGAVSASFSPSE